MPSSEVQAAGCVVRSGDRIAVIHRPRYDDWSLPKGKLDPGETFEEAAVREIFEEIGVRGELGDELPSTEYTDHKGRSKIVRYWTMEVDEVPEFVPNDEVDEVRWLGVDEALSLLSYDRDRALLCVNRDRFPGLAGGWARLDGPAGTQMVDDAIEAMSDFMRSGRNANAHGAFAAAAATDACVADARAAVGSLLNADPGGVIFGPSMTALTMRFARTVITPGDEVVCTRLDHDANVRPWVCAGADVRFADPEPGTLELRSVPVTERTKWVCVTAASNAVGTIPDLEAITAQARAVGARVYVDAVHATPHRAMDASLYDVLACSAYKWFGPHIGIQCASPAFLETLHPDKLIPSPDEVPDRFELGTLPFESLAGVAAAARYVQSLDWEAVHAHEQGLMSVALDGLAAIDGVTLYGGAAERTSTLMFTVAGRTSHEVAEHCAAREIAVWHGNYYAHELEQHLGLAPDGAVRAGFVHYNDEADAERLVSAVAELA